MGIKIYNLENRLLIYNESEKSIEYVSKEGATVSASNGNVIIAQNGVVKLNSDPEKITLPMENGLLDLIQIIDGYLASSPSGVFSGGWADYDDNATSGTPITITGGAGLTTLTNDTLGPSTNTSKLPFGVTKLWDPSTNKIDFTGMSVGDIIGIRVTIDVIVATNNTEIAGSLVMGSGGSSFEIPIINTANFKTTGTYTISEYTEFYIGSNDVLNNGCQVKLKSDTTCTVTVHGWFIKAIKVGSI